MKISCNIIEDLLPLYVDDMVSEDSRQLVEEHLKESEVKQMDGYVSVGMLTGKTVPDTGLD
mgnify:CR=1 FL=1